MESREPGKKTFMTLFPETENVHLTKDVGMIPFMMHKYFNYSAGIACYKNGEYPNLNREVNGLQIDFIDKISGNPEEDGKYYLIKNAPNIDILHLFHLGRRSLIWIYLYKHLNPGGKVYLKMDTNVNSKVPFDPNLLNPMKLCDLISVETKDVYEYFMKNWPVKIEYIPNGFYDNGQRNTVGFEEKENIICTVGRIGTHQKATEILMEAFRLAYPQISQWKLKIIGPIVKEFDAYINNFYNKNPHLKDQVVFTGAIADKQDLDEEYKKAKIFCLPSRNEGFPLVFCEAAKNGCFIISSDILPAWDITDNKKYGDIFEIDNILQLAEALVRCCSDESRLKSNCKAIQDFAYEKFYWVDICKHIDNFLKK